MKSFLSAATLLIAAALVTPMAGAADIQTAANDTKGLGSDTLVVMVSDSAFGPDGNDADAAARYYCANRGKVSTLVGKERPFEFRSQVLQAWSLFTYRCAVAGSN